MMGDEEKYGNQTSLWDSLFSTSHVFLLGVAIGSFLTYHYLCKPSASRSSDETTHYDTPGIKLPPEFLASTNACGVGGWRDSNPAHLATPNLDQTNRRRRSSLLYR